MEALLEQKNAVAAIRVSSLKQGLQGDSPEDQKQQIELFAKTRNIHIKKFFIFMESASKEEQPVQEAIDYCKNPSNDIQFCIIKSIDRFTRGGSYLYDHLKMQLVQSKVQLVDIYGIIGSQDVNTLSHLGLEYKWSVYSPTKKAEILEAERAKDEMRDIMTRMIGAEIRYVRMGYRVRQAPFGYVNEKIETEHGKRVILKPHPKESKWIKKMFELRALGTMSDHEIIDEVNSLGFKTRRLNIRSKQDQTKIIGQRGMVPLSLKQLWRYIQTPIYAGVNAEKWMQGKPIKTRFKGLVSIDVFNKANKGKLFIHSTKEGLVIDKDVIPDWQLNKTVKNPQFPYRRYVMCPHCSSPLFGSASRGKSGKYYPAYHCNKRGHYFRVNTKEFNETLNTFVQNLKITPEYAEELEAFVLEQWKQRTNQIENDVSDVQVKIDNLQVQARSIAEKIRFLSTETAIKYMEEDLVKIEDEIKILTETQLKNKAKTVDMDKVVSTTKYFLEHFEDLLIGSTDPLKRAAYFGLIFEQPPTYGELVSGTPKLSPFIALKSKIEGVSKPNGESAGTRTRDTKLKRLLLYQLSYGPTDLKSGAFRETQDVIIPARFPDSQ